MTYTMDDLTPEILDRIATSIRKDALPKPDYMEAWTEEFVKRVHAVIDMFDESYEIVTKAKLADQMTQMFERMATNLKTAGTRKRWELRDAKRNHQGIEITQLEIDKVEEQLENMRSQYYMVMHAYRTMRYNVRPKVVSDSGLNWGSYTPIEELPRVRRQRYAKNNLTIQDYMNDDKQFWRNAREAALVEIPQEEKESFA